MSTDTTIVDRQKYPELNLLLWDTCVREVDGKVAFETYERKWAYVDTERLNDNEKKLINRLTERYGKGVMLIA